jgi:hypothetical protein
MFGPLARLGFRMLPQLETTVRGGYLFGLDKKHTAPEDGEVTTNVSFLPIWLGVRYFVLEPEAGPYVAAEVGVNFAKAKVRGTALGRVVDYASDREGRFGFNVGAGYVISRSVPIDLRAQFSHLNLAGNESHDRAALALGFSAGYTATF